MCGCGGVECGVCGGVECGVCGECGSVWWCGEGCGEGGVSVAVSD